MGKSLTGNFLLGCLLALLMLAASSSQAQNVPDPETAAMELTRTFNDAMSAFQKGDYQTTVGTGFTSTSGNDVALMAVPEAGTSALIMGGFGMLAFNHRLRLNRKA
jgi:hypothetical protein